MMKGATETRRFAYRCYLIRVDRYEVIGGKSSYRTADGEIWKASVENTGELSEALGSSMSDALEMLIGDLEHRTEQDEMED